MQRILLTGMSGAGKSTVLAAVAERGYRTVELEGPWCVPQHDGTQLWDEDRVTALLSEAGDDVIVVAGCEANMGAFLPRFDLVILLSAPADVIVERLRTRTTNTFGKTPEEMDRVMRDLDEVEPQLRRISDVEIDTSGPVGPTLDAVIAAIDAGPRR